MKNTFIDNCGEVDRVLSFPVNELSWKDDFPYLPEVEVKCCHDEKYLYVKFFITEYHVKASYLNDSDPVFKDSCAELFIQPEGCEFYYNFEVNPIGTLRAKKQGSRADFEMLSCQQLAKIIRIGSFSRNSVNINDASWEMELRIPFEIFGIAPRPGLKFRGNFYKCGDDTDRPHYLCWNRIDTPAPDFHRPEFFAEITLK